jgi:hypothetical protein
MPGSAIFGRAQFGTIVFRTYGALAPPVVTLSDLIRVMNSEIRRRVTANSSVHRLSESTSQVRTRINTTIER